MAQNRALVRDPRKPQSCPEAWDSLKVQYFAATDDRVESQRCARNVIARTRGPLLRNRRPLTFYIFSSAKKKGGSFCICVTSSSLVSSPNAAQESVCAGSCGEHSEKAVTLLLKGITSRALLNTLVRGFQDNDSCSTSGVIDCIPF